jgi:hypothetical protein
VSLGVVAFTLGACSWNKKEKDIDPNSPVKVQLPVYTEGTYKMEVVELSTLRSLNDLRGMAANFLMDAGSSDGKLQGKSPHIHYMRDSNDIIVAQDDLSLQLLTVYAHMEKLKNLDEASGAKDVLSYPRTVAVNAKFRSSEGILENNALYSGQYDALLVVPYTKADLPLMANAGVLGHEHFHALFQKLVIDPSKDRYPDPTHPNLHPSESSGLTTILHGALSLADKSDIHTKYHAALLRGVNEGFADFWGWIYSGDNNFVGRSLPQEKLNRELDIIPDALYGKDDLFEALQSGEDEDAILYRSYKHGTQLARALRNFSIIYAKGKKVTADEVRPLMAQVLTATLPALQKKIEALKDDEYLTLGQVASLFTDQVKDMKSEECFFIAKLMPGEDEKSLSMGNRCKSIDSNGADKGTVPDPKTQQDQGGKQ